MTVRMNGVTCYTFTSASANDGYVWAGHYNSDPSPCFSNVQLCTGAARAVDVTINDAALLDYESLVNHSLVVTVTDNGVDPLNLEDTAVIVVTLTDVNEPPYS